MRTVLTLAATFAVLAIALTALVHAATVLYGGSP